MRGTLLIALLIAAARGIIPAYAGNTAQGKLSHGFRRDHPRVCGEHPAKEERDAAAKGSSPRMRGTLARGRGSPALRGIIPAYAGNT